MLAGTSETGEDVDAAVRWPSVRVLPMEDEVGIKAWDPEACE